MMTSKWLIVISASAAALGACGSRNTANNSAINDSADANAMDANAAPASPTSSQGFANLAAASDQFEIQSSELAAGQAQSAAVKKFAMKMIGAHTASTAKLKAAAAGLTPPVTINAAMSPNQQQKLDSLKALHGVDFDTAYAAAQVEAHEAALGVLNAYAASGDNPRLQHLASELVPTVTAHLNAAKALK
jgi:putative membrane protein